jgi:hypothetical protein
LESWEEVASGRKRCAVGEVACLSQCCGEKGAREKK